VRVDGVAPASDENVMPASGGPLGGKQRRFLRSLGHHLEPVVQVGKSGVTEAVTAAVENALVRHELIKVRCGSECPLDRDEVAATLAQALTAEVVQTLGRTLLLYRPDPEHPRIAVP
jgi:RNA-binding protein